MYTLEKSKIMSRLVFGSVMKIMCEVGIGIQNKIFIDKIATRHLDLLAFLKKYLQPAMKKNLKRKNTIVLYI